MKSIMISIQPQWVEKILNGEKTIEIRKTMPKCELPCKVYIYCTRPKKWWRYCSYGYTSDELLHKTKDKIKMCDGFEFWDDEYDILNRKIVAEFTLNKCDKYTAEFVDDDCYEDIRLYVENEFAEYEDELYDEYIVTTNEEENPGDCELCRESCLSYSEIKNYVGLGFHDRPFYAWHIDNLIVYDKPKELEEFYSLKKCNSCKTSGYESSACRYDEDCKIPVQIKRPPQSWCYVEVQDESMGD